MSRINISETQFAFAFFHHFLLLNRDPDIRFVFPTLREEGNVKSKYAGSDLVICENLIIQFKMPEFLRMRGAIEIINKELDRDFVPFYRMPIKNSLDSCQFDLLKAAAKKRGNRVRYITPMFHVTKDDRDEDAFYKFFRAASSEAMKQVCSINLRQFAYPDHPLSKDDSHKICYSVESVKKGICYIFSEPIAFKAEYGLGEMQNGFLNYNDNPENFIDVRDNIASIVDVFFQSSDYASGILNIEDPIDAIQELQNRLLSLHNIFWVPVLRDRGIRRSRILIEKGWVD